MSLFLQHFLKDVEKNGKYNGSKTTLLGACRRAPLTYFGVAAVLGFPCLGFHWQPIENKAMRRCLKVKGSQDGVVIRRIFPVSGAKGAVEKDDVLLEFDGTRIGSDGTVIYRGSERISFIHLGRRIFACVWRCFVIAWLGGLIHLVAMQQSRASMSGTLQR